MILFCKSPIKCFSISVGSRIGIIIIKIEWFYFWPIIPFQISLNTRHRIIIEYLLFVSLFVLVIIIYLLWYNCYPMLSYAILCDSDIDKYTHSTMSYNIIYTNNTQDRVAEARLSWTPIYEEVWSSQPSKLIYLHM